MAKDDPTSSQWKRFARLKTPSSKQVRSRARRIENLTIRHAHRFIISRWANLKEVRRHAIGWLLLASLLVVVTLLQLIWIRSNYVAKQPVEGGMYAEGVVGRLDTLNPIYAATQSERSASNLLFSSLLRYDAQNNLESDLAETYTRSDDGKEYTVHMRKDANWHDGKRVTADDVMFTMKLIKNPASRSYMYRTWQDIKVEEIDRYTLKFVLNNPYAPFPHALTFGILPKHILETTAPARMRENTFNRQPVGSGPFVFRNIQSINPATDRAVLSLVRNDSYYRGPVKLERFQLHTFKTHDDLRKGFLSQEINAANDVTARDVMEIKKDSPNGVTVSSAKLNNAAFAFLRMDSPILQDAAVRKALVKATNQREIIKSIGGLASPLYGPLLADQIGGRVDTSQAMFDKAAAEAELDAAGWVRGQNGSRMKDGQPLTLIIVAPKRGDFIEVAETLAKQWQAVGVSVNIQKVDADTLEQNIIKPRAYDVLIYELALGADPDVFAYWHSSQASVRGYNLSNYKSSTVDDALIGARARIEPDLRQAKYLSFYKQWVADAPAVALYQPHLHYIMTDGTMSMARETAVVDDLNRYHQIETWTIQSDEQFKTP